MSALATLRRVNAKARPEESIGLRVAVLIAVLAAVQAVLAQGIGGPSLRVGATAGIAAGFAYSHWARHRSGFVLKIFLAIAVIAAFGSFLQQVLGAGEIVAVQAPLAELFLWVQLLHSLDVPARRDLLFSLVSSLVLIAVAGVLSRSTGLGVNLVVWAGAALASLVLAHRSELADLPALAAARSRSPRARAWAVSRPVVGSGALVAVVAVSALLVVPQAGPGRAVTFPSSLRERLAVPQAGGLSNPALGSGNPARGGGSADLGDRASFGYFGFTDRLDTSLRGRPDDTLVMRVKAERPDFWRGQTFDAWDGRTWRQSDTTTEVTRGHNPIGLRGAPEDHAQQIRERGREFIQTYFVERPGPNVVFAANVADQLYISDNTVFEMSDGTVRTAVELGEGAVYTVVSRRVPVTAETLRASDGVVLPDSAGWRALRHRYLQLPEEVPDRVTALAREVTASSLSTYDKVRALEAWMGANTTYSIDAPPLPAGADAVEQFLFEDRIGFCEQIASSLVVMLRSLGIPARLAVGYTPGERNPFTGLYEVRASNAHAWAEVLFPGVGWQAFDPTAQVPLSGETISTRAGAGLLAWLGARLPSRAALLTTAAVLLALGMGALAVAHVRRTARRVRARRARPWRTVAMDRLEHIGATAGRPRRASEGPARYAQALQHGRVGDERLELVGRTIEADTFGGAPMSAAERALVDDVLSDLEDRQRGRAPAPV